MFEDLSTYLDDDESLDRVVGDVLRRWQARDPDNAPAELGGPDGFWNRYADQVEFPPAGSTNEFRPEFCPQRPGPFDTENYYRAVWRSHVADLPATGATRVSVS